MAGLHRAGRPPGIYHPEMMARRWFSSRYYNSPMPHAIFFHCGYAIHGTYDIAQLGGLASHGSIPAMPPSCSAWSNAKA